MPELNGETLKAMREAATKAQKKCPGPWFVESDDAEECGPHANSGLFMIETGRSANDPIARLCEATEASHIAKCDPDSILALIAEYERLKKENERREKVGREAFASELLGQLDRITSTTAAFHLVRNLCKIELGQEPDSLGLEVE